MEHMASSSSLSRLAGKDDASLLKSGKRKVGLPLDLPKVGKRAFDFVVASSGVVFLLPLFLLLVGVLLVLQGRPIFIRHNRVGRGGAFFPCLKFRSMVT